MTYSGFTILLLILAISFTSFNIVAAQEYIADVEYYSPENGLAGRYANCSYKDSRGIFWIGTQFGLSRFDGRDFLNFNEGSGLPFNQVMEIHEDSDAWFWLFRNCQLKTNCTQELVFFHSVTHEIHTFEEHLANHTDLRSGDIESIIENKNGDIFFSAKKKVYQWSSGKIVNIIDFAHLESTPQLIASISNNKIAAWNYLEDKKKKPYISYFVFDFKGASNYSRKIKIHEKGRTNNGIRILGSDNEGNKIIGIRNLNNVLDSLRFVVLKNGELSSDIDGQYGFSGKQEDSIKSFRPQLWFRDKAFSIENVSKGINYGFINHFLELTEQKRIREFRFYENNIFWTCGREGAYRYQIRSSHFKRILFSPYSGKEYSLKSIARGITPIGNNEFLVTTNNEIHEINLEDSIYNQKILSEKQSMPFVFTKGFRGDLWGFRKGDLFRLSKAKNTFQVRISNIENPKNPPKVLSQYYENERLWLGTDQGLHYFDHNREQWFECEKYNGFDELKGLLISHIYEETKDRVWLCTTGGLYLFSPKNGILERFWKEGVGKYKLPVNSIYHIQPSQKGGWWLATRKGLVYWNPSSEKEIHYSIISNDLVSHEVLAVHEDDFGFVWLATNSGLVQFHIETRESKVWLENDGISSVDFEPHSYFAQNDGTVWFGTTNGYTVFNPKDFKDIDLNDRPDIPLSILDYEQFSIETEQLENRTQELLFSSKITLHPGEELFNIRVALADYISGSEAKYAYRIKGVFNLWQEGKENLIRISNLPYGEHQLEIRGKLASGQYSSQEINIPISVLKPFYLQNWFLIMLVGSFVGMIFFGYLWRIKQLTKQQKKLEHEVKDRTKIIKKQSEELLQLDKLKSRFFANVSHELRTPLTLMLGPTDSLMNRDYIKEKDKKLLEYVYKNEKHLLNLVNEILDLSKLETNRLEIEEQIVNLHDLLTPLVAQFKSYGDSENVKFSFVNRIEKDYQIYLDTGKFEKIINNFLSNALKFTPKNGEVTLILKEQGNKFLILVKDNGSGIHPDDLPHVFERFFQSKQTDAQIQGGTGIGLSMSHELAKILGGRVWAESELGKGSIFYFEFPKKEALLESTPNEGFQPIITDQQAIEITTAEAIPKHLENKEQNTTILVVEDNPELRSYLQIILEEKYEVLTAENGKIALEILTQKSVDFIISDLMMPIMDGFQLLEAVKSKDRLRHLPVIMLTARADVKVKLRALRIGVDDYMIKPFREEELLTRIANLLKNYRVRISMSELAEPTISENPVPEIIIPEEDLQWLQIVEESVLKYLNDNRLNIDFLATQLAVSRSTFKRKIKRLSGLSPNDYLNEIRFNKVRELMEAKTVTSVKAAASEVGMKDVKYFSKQFKNRFGKLPSSYF